MENAEPGREEERGNSHAFSQWEKKAEAREEGALMDLLSAQKYSQQSFQLGQ